MQVERMRQTITHSGVGNHAWSLDLDYSLNELDAAQTHAGRSRIHPPQDTGLYVCHLLP